MGDGKGEGSPALSPLTGAYLLVILPQTHAKEHLEPVIHKLTKGLLSWDSNCCHVDLYKELQTITSHSPEGELVKHGKRLGERLIQFASENLVTEVLIHPQLNTLVQCLRNLLSSFTRHRHIIHAGYTYSGNGSWILQDGTFSFADFHHMFQEIEVQRVLVAYENTVTMDIHCCQEGDWANVKVTKEPFAKLSRLSINPDDKISVTDDVKNFAEYLRPYIVSYSLEQLLEPSDVVGNIRFSHPTLYVFPGGQGDAALFGINGFNMLVDGGFSRKTCFWDFTRHLDRLDAALVTRLNNGNIQGISSFLQRKKMNHVYPQIGHFFCNVQDRRHPLSPDGDKDRDPMLINIIDQGQELVSSLHHLNLKPQSCYRDSSMSPINLYHKVGHGKLDMYVLSPAKDSREVKDFIARWNANDIKLFATINKKSGEFSFPLPNRVSICALLVWQPANPNDNITRLLFPGSTPQHKIMDGLEKIKHLDFLKYPVCSAKSLSPSSSTIGLNVRQNVKLKPHADKPVLPIMNDVKPVKIPEPLKAAKTDVPDAKIKPHARTKKVAEKTREEKIKEEKLKEEKAKEDKIKDEKEDKPKEDDREQKDEKTEIETVKEKDIIPEKAIDSNAERSSEDIEIPRQVEIEISNEVIKDSLQTENIITDQKDNEKVIEKNLENLIDDSKEAKTDAEAKEEIISVEKPKKDADTKKPKSDAVKRGDRVIRKKELPEKTEKIEKEDRPKRAVTKRAERKGPKPPVKSEEKKPESAKSSPTTPKKTPVPKVMGEPKTRPLKSRPSPSATPAKSTKEENNRKVVEQRAQKIQAKKEEVKKIERKPLTRKAPTESPREVKKEKSPMKAVTKAKPKKPIDKESKITATSAPTPSAQVPPKGKAIKGKKIAENEIKIISDIVKDSDVLNGDASLSKEEDEILIVEKIELELYPEEVPSEEKEAAVLIEKAEIDKAEGLVAELKEGEAEEIKEEVTGIIQTATDIVMKVKSPEEAEKPIKDKIAVKEADKELKEKSNEMEQKQQAEESHPDEKFSATVESGATTTAPTLPEDERIPIEDVKEVEGIEEKHVKEETKEKDLQQRPEQLESKPEPAVTAFDQKAQILRDIVKTPDEVADLPVHEVADYEAAEPVVRDIVQEDSVRPEEISGDELKFIKDGLEKEDKSKDLKEDLKESPESTVEKVVLKAVEAEVMPPSDKAAEDIKDEKDIKVEEDDTDKKDIKDEKKPEIEEESKKDADDALVEKESVTESGVAEIEKAEEEEVKESVLKVEQTVEVDEQHVEEKIEETDKLDDKHDKHEPDIKEMETETTVVKEESDVLSQEPADVEKDIEKEVVEVSPDETLQVAPEESDQIGDTESIEEAVVEIKLSDPIEIKEKVRYISSDAQKKIHIVDKKEVDKVKDTEIELAVEASETSGETLTKTLVKDVAEEVVAEEILKDDTVIISVSEKDGLAKDLSTEKNEQKEKETDKVDFTKEEQEEELLKAPQEEEKDQKLSPAEEVLPDGKTNEEEVGEVSKIKESEEQLPVTPQDLVKQEVATKVEDLSKESVKEEEKEEAKEAEHELIVKTEEPVKHENIDQTLAQPSDQKDITSIEVKSEKVEDIEEPVDSLEEPAIESKISPVKETEIIKSDVAEESKISPSQETPQETKDHIEEARVEDHLDEPVIDSKALPTEKPLEADLDKDEVIPEIKETEIIQDVTEKDFKEEIEASTEKVTAEVKEIVQEKEVAKDVTAPLEETLHDTKVTAAAKDEEDEVLEKEEDTIPEKLITDPKEKEKVLDEEKKDLKEDVEVLPIKEIPDIKEYEKVIQDEDKGVEKETESMEKDLAQTEETEKVQESAEDLKKDVELKTEEVTTEIKEIEQGKEKEDKVLKEEVETTAEKTPAEATEVEDTQEGIEKDITKEAEHLTEKEISDTKKIEKEKDQEEEKISKVDAVPEPEVIEKVTDEKEKYSKEEIDTKETEETEKAQDEEGKDLEIETQVDKVLAETKVIEKSKEDEKVEKDVEALAEKEKSEIKDIKKITDGDEKDLKSELAVSLEKEISEPKDVEQSKQEVDNNDIKTQVDKPTENDLPPIEVQDDQDKGFKKDIEEPKAEELPEARDVEKDVKKEEIQKEKVSIVKETEESRDVEEENLGKEEEAPEEKSERKDEKKIEEKDAEKDLTLTDKSLHDIKETDEVIEEKDNDLIKEMPAEIAVSEPEKVEKIQDGEKEFKKEEAPIIEEAVLRTGEIKKIMAEEEIDGKKDIKEPAEKVVSEVKEIEIKDEEKEVFEKEEATPPEEASQEVKEIDKSKDEGKKEPEKVDALTVEAMTESEQVEPGKGKEEKDVIKEVEQTLEMEISKDKDDEKIQGEIENDVKEYTETLPEKIISETKETEKVEDEKKKDLKQEDTPPEKDIPDSKEIEKATNEAEKDLNSELEQPSEKIVPETKETTLDKDEVEKDDADTSTKTSAELKVGMEKVDNEAVKENIVATEEVPDILLKNQKTESKGDLEKAAVESQKEETGTTTEIAEMAAESNRDVIKTIDEQEEKDVKAIPLDVNIESKEASSKISTEIDSKEDSSKNINVDVEEKTTELEDYVKTFEDVPKKSEDVSSSVKVYKDHLKEATVLDDDTDVTEEKDESSLKHDTKLKIEKIKEDSASFIVEEKSEIKEVKETDVAKEIKIDQPIVDSQPDKKVVESVDTVKTEPQMEEDSAIPEVTSAKLSLSGDGVKIETSIEIKEHVLDSSVKGHQIEAENVASDVAKGEMEIREIDDSVVKVDSKETTSLTSEEKDETLSIQTDKVGIDDITSKPSLDGEKKGEVQEILTYERQETIDIKEKEDIQKSKIEPPISKEEDRIKPESDKLEESKTDDTSKADEDSSAISPDVSSEKDSLSVTTVKGEESIIEGQEEIELEKGKQEKTDEVKVVKPEIIEKHESKAAETEADTTRESVKEEKTEKPTKTEISEIPIETASIEKLDAAVDEIITKEISKEVKAKIPHSQMSEEEILQEIEQDIIPLIKSKKSVKIEETHKKTEVSDHSQHAKIPVDEKFEAVRLPYEKSEVDLSDEDGTKQKTIQHSSVVETLDDKVMTKKSIDEKVSKEKSVLETVIGGIVTTCEKIASEFLEKDHIKQAVDQLESEIIRDEKETVPPKHEDEKIESAHHIKDESLNISQEIASDKKIDQATVETLEPVSEKKGEVKESIISEEVKMSVTADLAAEALDETKTKSFENVSISPASKEKDMDTSDVEEVINKTTDQITLESTPQELDKPEIIAQVEKESEECQSDSVKESSDSLLDNEKSGSIKTSDESVLGDTSSKIPDEVPKTEVSVKEPKENIIVEDTEKVVEKIEKDKFQDSVKTADVAKEETTMQSEAALSSDIDYNELPPQQFKGDEIIDSSDLEATPEKKGDDSTITPVSQTILDNKKEDKESESETIDSSKTGTVESSSLIQESVVSKIKEDIVKSESDKILDSKAKVGPSVETSEEQTDNQKVIGSLDVLEKPSAQKESTEQISSEVSESDEKLTEEQQAKDLLEKKDSSPLEIVPSEKDKPSSVESSSETIDRTEEKDTSVTEKKPEDLKIKEEVKVTAEMEKRESQPSHEGTKDKKSDIGEDAAKGTVIDADVSKKMDEIVDSKSPVQDEETKEETKEEKSIPIEEKLDAEVKDKDLKETLGSSDHRVSEKDSKILSETSEKPTEDLPHKDVDIVVPKSISPELSKTVSEDLETGKTDKLVDAEDLSDSDKSTAKTAEKIGETSQKEPVTPDKMESKRTELDSETTSATIDTKSDLRTDISMDSKITETSQIEINSKIVATDETKEVESSSISQLIESSELQSALFKDIKSLSTCVQDQESSLKDQSDEIELSSKESMKEISESIKDLTDVVVESMEKVEILKEKVVEVGTEVIKQAEDLVKDDQKAADTKKEESKCSTESEKATTQVKAEKSETCTIGCSEASKTVVKEETVLSLSSEKESQVIKDEKESSVVKLSDKIDKVVHEFSEVKDEKVTDVSEETKSSDIASHQKSDSSAESTTKELVTSVSSVTVKSLSKEISSTVNNIDDTRIQKADSAIDPEVKKDVSLDQESEQTESSKTTETCTESLLKEKPKKIEETVISDVTLVTKESEQFVVKLDFGMDAPETPRVEDTPDFKKIDSTTTDETKHIVSDSRLQTELDTSSSLTDYNKDTEKEDRLKRIERSAHETVIKQTDIVERSSKEIDGVSVISDKKVSLKEDDSVEPSTASIEVDSSKGIVIKDDKEDVIQKHETETLEKTIKESSVTKVSSEKETTSEKNQLQETSVKTVTSSFLEMESSRSTEQSTRPEMESSTVRIISEKKEGKGDVGVSSVIYELRKDVQTRSDTPGSDVASEIESAIPRSDLSSGQATRSAAHWETSEGRQDLEHFESDEEIPGSPMSIASHIPSPPNFDYELRGKESAMTSSFYGSLPDDPDKKDTFAAMYISKYEDDSEVDPKVFSPSKVGTFEAKVSSERRDSMNLNGTKDADKTIPEPRAESSKDPIESWGKPLGLPPPPKSMKNFDDWNPIVEWGHPLGLPSPAPPAKENGDVDLDLSNQSPTRRKIEKLNAENERIASNIYSGKETINKILKRSESPVKKGIKSEAKKGTAVSPIYLDLTYVPHHGNSHYADVEFFKKIRARYYVFSGTEPSKEVFNALLEAKQTWEDKDLEVTIIPTYDTDTLAYWVAENEETLTKNKIDLSPSASRCTINLQDHETSCSAYRLEF